MTDAADPQETGRRQGKSAAAFRTISEVASDLDIPAHVLRFWESKFTQVKPLKRGGGRRYYRPEDIELLRGIRELLYTDGYTIKGVQKLLREGGVKQVLAEQSRQPGTPTTEKAAAREDAQDPPTQTVSSPDAATIDRAALRQVLGELEDLRATLKNVGI